MASEGTYEYECMRAELLGIEKPDYEAFMKNKAEREIAEHEALEAETCRETQAEQEGFQQTNTKLDELNTILKSTQKKIDSFTAPFSKFFRSKMGLPTTDPPTRDEIKADIVEQTEGLEGTEEANPSTKTAETGYMPIIDGIIEQFERMHTNMECQNKQMKKKLK